MTILRSPCCTRPCWPRPSPSVSSPPMPVPAPSIRGGSAGGDRSYHGPAQRHADHLWALPRGIAREGEAGAHSMTWTSRYGSVVAAGFDAGTADGMNEKGWWPTSPI